MTYAVAFRACREAASYALELYGAMRRRSLEPSARSCNQVLAACGSCQLWVEAAELLENARAMGLELTEVTTSTLLRNDLAWRRARRCSEIEMERVEVGDDIDRDIVQELNYPFCESR